MKLSRRGSLLGSTALADASGDMARIAKEASEQRKLSPWYLDRERRRSKSWASYFSQPARLRAGADPVSIFIDEWAAIMEGEAKS